MKEWKVETMDKGIIEKNIKDCENSHVQQIAYSAYHMALTQLCFGCKKIRTSMSEEEFNFNEELSK